MRRRSISPVAAFGVALVAALIFAGPPQASPAPAGGTADVLTFHGDAARTGWNAGESSLTLQRVRPGSFGKVWSTSVDGEIYAEPLVASGVPGPSGPRTLVYVVTERDLAYALDGSTGARVWGPVALGTPVARADLPCGDIDPVGITATPVVDRASSTLYAVGLTTPDGGRTKVYKAAALDLATGRVRAGWPVAIAPPPSAGRRFDAGAQQQRGALALVNGVVYVPFGGYWGDCGDYHGWVVGVPAASPASQQAYATPTGREGGIWATGGAATDSDAALYVATGNSDSTGPMDFGDAVLRLTTRPALRFSGAPRDYFAPSNYVALNNTDGDLGSTAPLVLPPQSGSSTPRLLFIAGKQGVGYLVNRDDLGGVSKGSGITGEGVYSRCVFGTCQEGRPEVFSAAAYWDAGGAGRLILVPGRGEQPSPCGGSGGVVALRLGTNGESHASMFDVAWCSASMDVAGAPAVSSSGDTNGIVWVVDSRASGLRAGAGTLYALNALTGATLYASSGQDALGSAHQFITPAVAGGRVYVGAGHTVVAYALHDR